MMKNNKTLNTVYDFVSILVTALIVVLVIFTFIFKISVISGSSMESTLHHGDKVIVTSVPKDIKYGDIVIVSQPNAYNKVLIKRVVGVGGQTISFDRATHKTLVDGKPLEEKYIKEPMNMSSNMMQIVTVPEGHLFVMGDNRNNSGDSRYPGVGTIDERYIVGKVVYRIGDKHTLPHDFKEKTNA